MVKEVISEGEVGYVAGEEGLEGEWVKGEGNEFRDISEGAEEVECVIGEGGVISDEIKDGEFGIMGVIGVFKVEYEGEQDEIKG